MKINNQWDEKYLREQPFMAFGSLMNAWARINTKKTALKTFLKDSEDIFELAQKLTELAMEKSRGEEPKTESKPMMDEERKEACGLKTSPEYEQKWNETKQTIIDDISKVQEIKQNIN